MLAATAASVIVCFAFLALELYSGSNHCLPVVYAPGHANQTEHEQPPRVTLQRSGTITAEDPPLWAALVRTRNVTFPVLKRGARAVDTKETDWFWKAMQDGSWEPATFKGFAACIGPTTSVIDFGTWVGPTVMFASMLGSKAVYGFEPDPRAHSEMVVNAKLNGLVNVIPHHACVGPKSGNLTMYYRDGNSMSSTYKDGLQAPFTGFTKEINVSCYTLNDVVDFYGIPPSSIFIKMDIEGFEVDLLPTLKDFFNIYRPSMHLSLHPAVRTFTDASWEVIYDALSAFPLVYQEVGSSWKEIPLPSGFKSAVKGNGGNNALLLTWPGQCKAPV